MAGADASRSGARSASRAAGPAAATADTADRSSSSPARTSTPSSTTDSIRSLPPTAEHTARARIARVRPARISSSPFRSARSCTKRPATATRRLACSPISPKRDSASSWRAAGAAGRDPAQDLDILRRELELFQPTLAAKPQMVAANKIDALDEAARAAALEKRAADLKLPFFRISGATGAGVAELVEAMWHRLAASRQSAA